MKATGNGTARGNRKPTKADAAAEARDRGDRRLAQMAVREAAASEVIPELRVRRLVVVDHAGEAVATLGENQNGRTELRLANRATGLLATLFVAAFGQDGERAGLTVEDFAAPRPNGVMLHATEGGGGELRAWDEKGRDVCFRPDPGASATPPATPPVGLRLVNFQTYAAKVFRRAFREGRAGCWAGQQTDELDFEYDRETRQVYVDSNDGCPSRVDLGELPPELDYLNPGDFGDLSNGDPWLHGDFIGDRATVAEAARRVRVYLDARQSLQAILES